MRMKANTMKKKWIIPSLVVNRIDPSPLLGTSTQPDVADAKSFLFFDEPSGAVSDPSNDEITVEEAGE